MLFSSHEDVWLLLPPACHMMGKRTSQGLPATAVGGCSWL